jgi:hypothetical protein
MQIILAVMFGVAGSMLIGLAIHDTFGQAWQVLNE